MALDGCGLTCKYTLFLFNLIFGVLGLAFLVLGLWLRFSGNTRAIFQVEELNSSAFVMCVTVLIVLGTVMVILVMFGDYGACNEKRTALKVFSVLITILAVAEIAVGVLVFTRRARVGLYISEFYSSLYAVYVASGDPAIAATLTFIHWMLHCCGVTGVKIIELAQQTCPKPDGFWEHLSMPSCPLLIVTAFTNNASMVMGVFIGIGVLLITAVVCSCILLQQMKRDQEAKSEYYTSVY